MKAWWSWVLENYSLEQHHLRILQAACEAWDRMQQAREVVAKHGVLIEDRFGAPKANPAAKIEIDCRASFVRCVRELGLDVEGAPVEPPRPPVMKGNGSRKK